MDSPIVEALSVGTPVIVSDIPCHREAGGVYPTYLSPIDGVGWLEAIVQHTSGRGTSDSSLLPPFTPISESFYSSLVEAFVAAVAEEPTHCIGAAVQQQALLRHGDL